MSDLIGRRVVAIMGSFFVIAGMIMMGFAHRMDVAIGGASVVGVGAGLAELVGAAGIMEITPVRKRGKYMAIAFLVFLPYGGCPAYGMHIYLFQKPLNSVAQLYSAASTWRWGAWIAVIIGGTNVILVLIFYHPPPRVNSLGLTRTEILQRIDFVGGLLSVSGLSLFLLGIQWGGYN